MAVTGLVVGCGVDDAEHVAAHKRQEVPEWTERLLRTAVALSAECRVERDVLTIVKHPDEQLSVLDLRPLAFGLLGRRWAPPQLEHDPGGEPWETGVCQAQGTQQRRQRDIVCRGEGEALLPCTSSGPGGPLHPSGRPVEVGVHGQHGVLTVQPRHLPLALIVKLLPADDSKLSRGQTRLGTAAPATAAEDTREGQSVAEVAQQRVHRVGGPQLTSGDAQSPRHVGVGPVQLSVAHPQLVLPPLLLLQVVVAGGAVARGAAEQRAPLVTHAQLCPVEVRQEAIKEGQATLHRSAPAGGLEPQLAGGPVGRQEVIVKVGLP